MEPTHRKRLFRFRLRTLLLLVLVFGVWLGWQLDRARKQKLAVQTIQDAGGWVKYDFQYLGTPDFGARGNFDPDAVSPVPRIILDKLGYDFFHDVVSVNLVYDDDGTKRLDNDRQTKEWANHLDQLSDVRGLFIHGKQADDQVLKRIGKLKKLTVFYLWNGLDITDEGVQHLVKAKNLEAVHLGNGQLGDASLKHFASLPKVRTLSLQGNAFTDSGLEHLRDKTDLTALWVGMGDNRITDDGLRYLYGLSKLKTLGVQYNHASPEAEAKLKAALPGCKIHFSRRSQLLNTSK